MTASQRLTRRAAPKSQTRSARSSFVPTADRCSMSLATKTLSSVLRAAPFRTPRVGLKSHRPDEQSRTRTDRISCRLDAWVATIAQFTTTSPSSLAPIPRHSLPHSVRNVSSATQPLP
jgi:hypothetical protein